MKNPTLEEIKSQRVELNKVENKLLDKEYKDGLPAMKKKYVGKFYKTRNSYSSGNKWWLYMYVKAVSSKRDYYPFKVLSFQQIPYKNEIEFVLNDEQTKRIDDFIPVTRKEFMTAFNKAKSAINKLKF